MDERGLWKLFFVTGLPETYLAIQGARTPRTDSRQAPAQTAFRPADASLSKL